MSALKPCPNNGKCGHAKHDPSKGEYARCEAAARGKSARGSAARIAPPRGVVTSTIPKGYPPVDEMAEEFYDATISPRPEGYYELPVWRQQYAEWSATADPSEATNWYVTQYPPEDKDFITFENQSKRMKALREQGIDPEGTDDTVFGTELVYCGQHMTVHDTGWCTVGLEDKLPVAVPRTGERSSIEGLRVARRNGWPQYRSNNYYGR